MSYSYEFFTVTDSEVDEYEKTFPGVPLAVEFSKMKLWLRVNPARRPKNERGYRRFVVRWLSRTHGRLLEAEVHGTAIALAKEDSVRRQANQGANYNILTESHGRGPTIRR